MRLNYTPEEERFRDEVRAWLAANLPKDREKIENAEGENTDEWMAFLKGWQRKLYDAGWAGISWPKEYGGRGATINEQLIFTEEMARAKAPNLMNVSIGIELVGPAIIHHGTEEQKRRYLPKILSAEEIWSQGFSEPGAGSDLASLQTRAEVEDDHFVITGQKVWTSWAHKAHAFFVLCRTSPQSDDRHEGLSQLIVELKAPGVTVRPIRFMNAHHHFNEVFLDNVFVPDEMVVGEIGQGWKQVTSELALERSGPERYMTTFPLLVELIRRLGPSPDGRAQETVGRLTARMWTLRRMSLAIALALDPGVEGERGSTRAAADLATEAALVKDMGTFYEREIVDAARLLVSVEPRPDAPDTFERYLAETIVSSPISTIRGGTTQVLRTLIARRLLGSLK